MKKNYATRCNECQFIQYLAKNDLKGLCNRLGDPNFIFMVELNNSNCLYRDSGEIISPNEILNRKKQALETYLTSLESENKVKEIIQSWPKWKQDLAKTLV
ncbi:hypothetical protein M0R19_00365 [Candidatus Pacearchaeota archaeon]|jgi:hypothetical protein|nr:hypothetical protein [Candidatus Pacearchaeota archaeon]